jgi:DNA polymerase (family 10)
MKNLEVARVLNRIADLLELRDESAFKIRAYRRAANTLNGLVEDVAAVIQRDGLEELPGIGASIGGKIDEIVATGTCAAYEELRKEFPHGLLALTSIDGIGPKTARQLWASLGIDSLEKLELAAKEQRIRKVAGMGEKKEKNILRSLEARRNAGDRVPYYVGNRIAFPVLTALQSRGMTVEVAGSMRRFCETIADVDFLVATHEPGPVTEAFLTVLDPAEVLAKGDTKTSVRMADGFRVDLRVIEPGDWGAALCYFTGSKTHNIRLRQLAIQKGLKLNEYGLWRENDGVRVAGATEEEVYDALGLPFIPPELREDQGEVEAALAGKLPTLVELSDIQGDLHAHTDASDGVAPLPALAEAARAKGYQYLAVTDHTQSLTIAKGLSPSRVDEQIHSIAEWNRSNGSDAFRLLTGTESDIHDDGTLDLPDETLSKLDFVIGSLHGKFRMARDEMTARVTRALSHPSIDVMGHPSGRLMPDREPVEWDFDAVLAAAKEHRTALEINSSPHRMDLSASNVRRAKEAGVKVTISTDTHSLRELDHMSWGVRQARRGWLEKTDVLNALPREAFLAYVRADGG